MLDMDNNERIVKVETRLDNHDRWMDDFKEVIKQQNAKFDQVISKRVSVLPALALL